MRSGRRRLAEIFMDYGIVAAFAAIFVALAVSNEAFLSVRNLLNILDQASQLGIIAAAATIVIIAGGFDLSAGANFALAGVVAAVVTNATGSAALGIFAGLLAGLILGLGNGVLVTVLRINTFVATLASGFVIRGLALVLTQGLLITVADPGFTWLGRANILGVKATIYVFLAFALVMALLLRRTTFGRNALAVGDNPEAARLAGIRVQSVRIATFGLTGLAAALSGVIAASRIATGQANVGEGLELTAIAAVVIGGTSIMGGEGAVWRSFLAVLLLQLLNNGFNILNVPPFYQRILQGLIILFAVAFDALRHRRA